LEREHEPRKEKKAMTARNAPHGVLLIAAAAIVLVALAGCGGGDRSPSSSSPASEGAAAAGLRTVLVFDRAKAPSPSLTTLHAGLEEGSLPRGSTVATVLTDEDCAPDRQGISHCRNEVRVAGGGIVVLRHPHDMRQVPCLAPGEKVLLRRAA
jgi:hypothetical protein